MRIKIKDPLNFKKNLLIKGFSQRGFGRTLGISEPYANQIINGSRCPGPELARKISDLLEMEFEDIFFVDDACKSDQKDADFIEKGDVVNDELTSH